VDATFGTKGHTATMVPVFAFGPGAETFAGVYENTGIFDRIRAALGL
jgi:alkaline phosphatase